MNGQVKFAELYDAQKHANRLDPDQTAPSGSGSIHVCLKI